MYKASRAHDIMRVTSSVSCTINNIVYIDAFLLLDFGLHMKMGNSHDYNSKLMLLHSSK